MENNNYNNFSHKNIISVNELAHSGGLTIRETSKTNLYIVVISHHSTSVVLGTLGWVKAQVISTFERLKKRLKRNYSAATVVSENDGKPRVLVVFVPERVLQSE